MPPCGEIPDPLDDARARVLAGHELHQPHGAGRVEEMGIRKSTARRSGMPSISAESWIVEVLELTTDPSRRTASILR